VRDWTLRFIRSNEFEALHPTLKTIVLGSEEWRRQSIVRMHVSRTWLIIAMLLVSAALVGEVSAVEPPKVEWQKSYSAAETHCAIQTLDGGYALGGTVDLQQGTTCYFMKVDSQGHMQWNTTLDGLSGIVAAAVQTSDGGYALTGVSYGANYELFLVKLDASGNIMLNKTYLGMGDDLASCIFASNDGGYVLAGTMSAFTGAHLPSYPWLIRTDSNGEVVWSKTYGSGDLVAATQTVDNDYAILTHTSGGDVMLAKIDSNGQMIWNRTVAGLQGSSSVFYSLTQTSDGGFAISTSVSIGSDNGFWLGKTDSLGDLQWNSTYVGPGNDTVSWSLIMTSDGGFAMMGDTNVKPAAGYNGGARIWVVKTDANGIVQWSQTYGGPNGTEGRIIIQTKDGGYALVGGMTEMYQNNYPEFMYIAKLSSPAKTSNSGMLVIDVAVPVALAVVVAIVIGYAIFIKRKRAASKEP
jgi:hypothetical protein